MPLRERGRAAGGIVEHDHPHAPGLAPAARRERELADTVDAAPEAPTIADSSEPGRVPRKASVTCRCSAARADPVRGAAPASHDGVGDLRGKLEREEEPQSVTVIDASGPGHAALCRLCVRRRWARWSAPDGGAVRIAARSPGKENSSPRSSHGAETCRQTRPTGLASVPPSVRPRPSPRSRRRRRAAPDACRHRGRDLGRDGAVRAAMTCSGTPSDPAFTSLA